jgi:hypothetical protein
MGESSYRSRINSSLDAYAASLSNGWDCDLGANVRQNVTKNRLFRQRLSGSEMKLIDLADQFTSLDFAILLGQ